MLSVAHVCVYGGGGPCNLNPWCIAPHHTPYPAPGKSNILTLINQQKYIPFCEKLIEYYTLTVASFAKIRGQNGSTVFTESKSFSLHNVDNSCRAFIFVVESLFDIFLNTIRKSGSTLFPMKSSLQLMHMILF